MYFKLKSASKNSPQFIETLSDIFCLLSWMKPEYKVSILEELADPDHKIKHKVKIFNILHDF